MTGSKTLPALTAGGSVVSGSYAESGSAITEGEGDVVGELVRTAPNSADAM